jgi:hypothetical protein
LLHRSPGEHGAFDALREFADALEELKVAEVLGLRCRVSGVAAYALMRPSRELPFTVLKREDKYKVKA